jgi:hypothetical protein
MDENGGMWIKLTVCGVTRLGYGHPDGKKGGDAIKEVIGDALRNAAMRFGAALDLWHKGDLHAVEPTEAEAPEASARPDGPAPAAINAAKAALGEAGTLDALKAVFTGFDKPVRGHAEVIKAKDERKAALEAAANADLGYDQIPF